MAGPGGGPPRRSHTKSRKGCETCKRRHIRCDENFPQCRNCTKHKIRCPYNDITMLEERSVTPDRPDLMWTPESEAAIEQWQHTGVLPFPGLNIHPTPSPRSLSVEDMRLIYHVASISHQLGMFDANGFTLWTRQIPAIIKISASHRFVLHALLAFSAMHMTFLNECPLLGNMAYEHRGIALKGLQEAIHTFSQDNSDAVLAASLVLSWQATDWPSWTQLMAGTSSVIEAMGPWKHESQLIDFIVEGSTFPTAPPSPMVGHQHTQPSKEDVNAFQSTIQQLQKVEAYLKQNSQDTKQFAQLVAFVKGARKISTLPVAQQFDRLQPLRKWLFWLPVLYLQQTNGSPSALVVIAHYYAVAQLVERLFPEVGAAYFGSLTIGPVEEIARRLLSINISANVDEDLQTPITLMEFPIDTVNEFRMRMGWSQPNRTQSFPEFDPQNFYTDDTTTPEFLPYGDHPPFSYSTEDLSNLSTVSGPTSAVSPMLSSPFTNQQYLGIPSPYGGYSPASSTFGDFPETASVVYSDSEDYGVYDLGLSPATPVGGHGQYLTPTTPTYIPGDDFGAFTSSCVPNAVPSPYLGCEQFKLPFLDSPVPSLAIPSFACHRHTTSTASAPPTFSFGGIKEESTI